MTVPRFNVLGVGVHALDLPRATTLVVEAATQKRGAYVCCCDAHSITRARQNREHRNTLNAAYLTTPDGMPLVWLGKLAGYRDTQRVYGPDLLEAVCAATADTSLTHFFYGGAPGTATELARRLILRHPGLLVAGSHSPPVADAEDLPINAIARARPDFVWVGLSTPKQEAFMRRLAESETDFGVTLGVGAAFDFLSGNVRQAPLSIQRSGLEWLWRLFQEPGRLGTRYLRTAPLFALRAFGQISGLCHYPLEDR
ncbi:WecB/TagA/CpsF family glycosyltransferase [Synoicihabitans lomoniglobus]|uniref:WecB/TagA/CpsF family glycosyltransferase n=1 Tax=Synoicihabitans lomoniglobus TaxID=2909285 RepID=A0AAF0A1R0_9BACT|nr:WecB/TagA/CpsF family glycosyltransferase [Opitutaceae bacterium LMO-M01]WED65272.1 WecB/TagA/CpsF family glycosyltransferase [Opitutaceae bacterium LMO-M01]